MKRRLNFAYFKVTKCGKVSVIIVMNYYEV